MNSFRYITQTENNWGTTRQRHLIYTEENKTLRMRKLNTRAIFFYSLLSLTGVNGFLNQEGVFNKWPIADTITGAQVVRWDRLCSAFASPTM